MFIRGTLSEIASGLYILALDANTVKTSFFLLFLIIFYTRGEFCVHTHTHTAVMFKCSVTKKVVHREVVVATIFKKKIYKNSLHKRAHSYRAGTLKQFHAKLLPDIPFLKLNSDFFFFPLLSPLIPRDLFCDSPRTSNSTERPSR